MRTSTFRQPATTQGLLPLTSLLGLMLTLLPVVAQAQTNRSRPQPNPTVPSGSGGGGSGHSGSSSSGARSESGSRGVFSSAAASSGSRHTNSKGDFNTLFPGAKGGVPRTTEKGTGSIPSQTDGDIFGNVMIPGQPALSRPPASDSQNPPAVSRTSGNASTSLDRYRQTQEAGYGPLRGNSGGGSHHYRYYDGYSPFGYYDPFFGGWGYGYGWNPYGYWPGYDYGYGSTYTPIYDSYGGYSGYEVPWAPSSRVLLPQPPLDDPLGWPNLDLPNQRDDSARTYRIGEKTRRKANVSVTAALADIERAFQEGEASLLASHIRRDAKIGLTLPGAERSVVEGGTFLDRLQTLFRSRRTSSLEFEPPQTRDEQTFAVTGHYLYRDAAGTSYETKLRFVLQVQNGVLILMEFGITS